MSACRRVEPLLEAYTDGELAADKQVEVDQHLVECRCCAERVKLDQALRLSIKRVVREEVRVSAAFEERLRAALAAEAERDQAEHAVEVEKRRLLPRRMAVPVAAAAAAGVTLAWTAVQGPGDEAAGNRSMLGMSSMTSAGPQDNTVSDEQFIDELLNHHANAPAPEITEPWLVTKQLEPKVGLPVRLPTWQRYGARWEGGAVVFVRDQRAASLRFELSGHPVTVYVYDAKRFPRPRDLEVRMVDDAPVYVGSRRGYSIGMREQRGMGYAVTTDLSDRETAELVAAIR